MAGPARKRYRRGYRKDSFASDNEFNEDSVGPGCIFPSANEREDDDDS